MKASKFKLWMEYSIICIVYSMRILVTLSYLGIHNTKKTANKLETTVYFTHIAHARCAWMLGAYGLDTATKLCTLKV